MSDMIMHNQQKDLQSNHIVYFVCLEMMMNPMPTVYLVVIVIQNPEKVYKSYSKFKTMKEVMVKKTDCLRKGSVALSLTYL